MERADESGPGRGDVLSERLFQQVLQALELSHVWLGDQLGLYEALARLGQANPAELAKEAGISERYAREWLEQQAVAAIVDVAVPSGNPDERRYTLPAEHAKVLLDPDDLRNMVSPALSAVGVVRALPQVKEAFRTGSGVPYEVYGHETGNGNGNRAMYLRHLATDWLPALPDIHGRLSDGEGGRVADLGCGPGWSSIAMALSFPSAQVTGIDLDEASVGEARQNAAESGVADRVTFRRASADTLDGTYDLVCALSTLHDMSDPVSVLRAARRCVAADGAMFVAEERVAEEFTAPGDEMERFHYGWSAVSCLAASLNEQPSAAIGTAIRPATVRSLALSAGFSEATVLPVEHRFLRFYRFDP